MTLRRVVGRYMLVSALVIGSIATASSANATQRSLDEPSPIPSWALTASSSESNFSHLRVVAPDGRELGAGGWCDRTVDVTASSSGIPHDWRWSQIGDGFGNSLAWGQPADVTVNQTTSCNGSYTWENAECNVTWTESGGSGSGEVWFIFETASYSSPTSGRVFIRASFHPGQSITNDSCGHAETTTVDWPQVQVGGPGPSTTSLLQGDPFIIEFNGGGSVTSTGTPDGCPEVEPLILWFGDFRANPPTCG